MIMAQNASANPPTSLAQIRVKRVHHEGYAIDMEIAISTKGMASNQIDSATIVRNLEDHPSDALYDNVLSPPLSNHEIADIEASEREFEAREGEIYESFKELISDLHEGRISKVKKL